MIFRLILWAVGVLLAIASRSSARLRSQLARDLTFVICTNDGVSRTYVVQNRRFSSRAGSARNAACIVTFDTAARGARIFVARDAIGQIIDGLASRDIQCEGDATIILWFYELTMGLVPGRSRVSQVMPDGYVVPNYQAKVADRITREPAVAALDPTWTAEVTQREKLILWRVGRGAVPTGKSTHHKVVIDVPATAGAEK